MELENPIKTWKFQKIKNLENYENFYDENSPRQILIMRRISF